MVELLRKIDITLLMAEHFLNGVSIRDPVDAQVAQTEEKLTNVRTFLIPKCGLLVSLFLILDMYKRIFTKLLPFVRIITILKCYKYVSQTLTCIRVEKSL